MRNLLVFNLLYDCNNHCIFCCADTHYVKKLIPELNIETFLNTFRKYAIHPQNVIQLAGGEPLLYSQISAVFEEIKKAKAACCIRTNGRILSDNAFALSLLKDLKLRLIVPILASNLNDFTALSGNKAGYNETLKAIDNIYRIKTSINPELALELTIYICKGNILQNKEIIRMIKDRWPKTDSIDLCLIRIASQVCLKNKDYLWLSPDELYIAVNNVFDTINESQFEGAVSLNGIPFCFIQKKHFNQVTESINQSEYSEIPEMLFFDGRFNNVEKAEAITEDPVTCCSDITSNEVDQIDPKFIEICDKCAYNTVCNYRLAAGNIPSNPMIKEKILEFVNRLV